MTRLIKTIVALAIVLFAGILILSLWASGQIDKASRTPAPVAAQPMTGGATDKPVFEFRGLRIGTPLKEAQAKGIVEECDKITDYVGCRLAKREIGEVAIWQSYVDFTDGTLDELMIDVNSDWFDQLVGNLRTAYGEPCGSDTKKLQNTMGATFDGDEVWWCFSNGNLMLRRHNSDDFRKSGFVFEKFEAPKPPAKFNPDSL
jgi:hypothetical protein